MAAIIDWFKNPGTAAKAIWAFVLLIQPFLKMAGVELPGFLNEAWLSSTLLALAPIVVWWITNRMTAAQVAIAVVKQPTLTAELKAEGIVVVEPTKEQVAAAKEAVTLAAPVPVPGGDGKPHSSTMKPVARKAAGKGRK